ncbi:glycosyltransferase family 2 protein [Paenibacillus pinistramenti]|uniref:glycosyltransferase family 2 protein n=1 Tax=Paenibacillus pinistramenti TaxID=1768003 RepID=UPI00110839C3|nr:glycosyltransferase family 2 protein [Paenibacillus pinistramenti]
MNEEGSLTVGLLSLCMIVKNEEKVLERCLNSVKDTADEMIIIDTGSTDHTKEIARKFTEHVYDFEWINDFSAAKNEALKRATGKWILVLDADEYLTASDAQKMIEFLKTQEPQPHVVYNLSIINYTGTEKSGNMMESSADRLFPNFMDIWFERPIHEQLVSSRPGVQVRFSHVPFRIFHTGYLQETIKEKDKHTRNMEIFDLFKEKHAFDAYDHFTLGNEYQASGNFKKAAECYQNAVNGTNTKKKAWYPHALIGLINAKFKLDELTESWRLIEANLSFYKDYPEYYTIKAMHYEFLGWLDEAITHYKAAIDHAESMAKTKNIFWLVSPDYGSRIPLERLSELSFRLNRPSEGIFWLTKLLMNQPYQLHLLIKLLDWLSQNEDTASIRRLLDGMYKLDDSSDLLLLMQAALAVGQLDLFKHYSCLLADPIELRPADQLRLAILENDQDKWEAIVRRISRTETSETLIRHLQLGALIWKEPVPSVNSLIDDPDELIKAAAQVVNQVIHDDGQTNEELLDSCSVQLFNLTKDLYLLKQYEAYDFFISKVQHPKLVNSLANYFYSRNQLETAVAYYSILYNKNSLEAESCENLGMYYLSQNMLDEAAEFLHMAIKLDDKRKYLYYSFIRCLQGPLQQEVINQFREKYPQYIRLPFIKLL